MSPTAVPSAAFPGGVIKVGSDDKASILAIQARLNLLGCGPVQEDGVFSAQTLEAVQLFQARSLDFENRPLHVDGTVGPMTWASLFKSAALPAVAVAVPPILQHVLQIAGGEVGVMEQPPGSNRGPQVDQYLTTVGLNPAAGSFAWCAAFIYWCFKKASAELNVPNPAVKTAGALDVWNSAGAKGFLRLTPGEAGNRPDSVRPGMIFVLSTGGGHGHVGLIERVQGVVLTTIEGNTNDGGSREGVGVFRRNGRRIDGINQGFVDYSSTV